MQQCFCFSRIIKDHETHMKDMLKGGLEWLCSEKRGKGTHVAKLEGRYIVEGAASYYLKAVTTWIIACSIVHGHKPS